MRSPLKINMKHHLFLPVPTGDSSKKREKEIGITFTKIGTVNDASEI